MSVIGVIKRAFDTGVLFTLDRKQSIDQLSKMPDHVIIGSAGVKFEDAKIPASEAALNSGAAGGKIIDFFCILDRTVEPYHIDSCEVAYVKESKGTYKIDVIRGLPREVLPKEVIDRFRSIYR